MTFFPRSRPPLPDSSFKIPERVQISGKQPRTEDKKTADQSKKIKTSVDTPFFSTEFIDLRRIVGSCYSTDSLSIRASKCDLAVRAFMKTKGFQSDEGDTLHRGQRIGECQGSRETRIAAAVMTNRFPEALDHAVLRKHKDLNIHTYLTLVFKRLAHTCTIVGKIDIFGKEVLLEGFCEAYIVPMLASSFRQFVSDKKNPLGFDPERVIDQFLQTTFSDTITDRGIDQIVHKIKASNFKGPITIGSGYDWHYTQVIFYRDYVINLNRGRNISIYKIDRSTLTSTQIRKLAKRFETRSDGSDFDPGKELVKNCELLAAFNMKRMNAANCTHVNGKAGFLALMAIDNFELNIDKTVLMNSENEKAAWNQAFANVKPHYKEWTKYDRSMVCDEFLIDIEELKKIQEPNEPQKKLLGYYIDIFERLKIKMQASSHKFSAEIKEKVLNIGQK